MLIREDNKMSDMQTIGEITQRLYAWGRGCDRLDLEHMRSAFHSDAIIDYGYITGNAFDVLPTFDNFHKTTLVASSHLIFNPVVKVNGSIASSECVVECRLQYWVEKDLEEMTAMGRYLDRWERREGDWKIVHRTSVLDRFKTEIVHQSSAAAEMTKNVRSGERGPGDLSYQYV